MCDPRDGPSRNAEIEEEKQECRHERHAEHHKLRVQRPEKDALVAQFPEPEPVRVVINRGRDDQKQEDDCEEQPWQAAHVDPEYSMLPSWQ
jgi:hypothetical protein